MPSSSLATPGAAHHGTIQPGPDTWATPTRCQGPSAAKPRPVRSRPRTARAEDSRESAITSSASGNGACTGSTATVIGSAAANDRAHRAAGLPTACGPMRGAASRSSTVHGGLRLGSLAHRALRICTPCSARLALSWCWPGTPRTTSASRRRTGWRSWWQAPAAASCPRPAKPLPMFGCAIRDLRRGADHTLPKPLRRKLPQPWGPAPRRLQWCLPLEATAGIGPVAIASAASGLGR
jgi:hypothetical protein